MGHTGAWARAVFRYKIWRLLSLIIPCIAVGFACILFIILVGGMQEPLFSQIINFPNLLQTEYFDAQGQALLQGHWDVPCTTLKAEAFVIGGKCYGFWGLWPSIIRLPFDQLFPDFEGLWSRFMMILGGLLTYSACLLMARRAFQGKKLSANLWSTLFAFIVVTGSTLFFIVSDPYPYNELTVWASAFALWTLWLTGRYIDTGKKYFLWLALLAAMITGHTRATVGIGIALGMMVWFSAPFWQRMKFSTIFFTPRAIAFQRRTATFIIALLVIIMAAPIGVNYAKFGQITPPFAKQIWYQKMPGRLAKIKDGSFHLSNLRCSSAIFFSPANAEFTGKFPWIKPGQKGYWFAPVESGPTVENASLVGSDALSPAASGCSETYVENIDPSFSILYADLPLVFLTIIGLITLTRSSKEVWQRWLPLLLAGGLAAGPTMLYSAVNYRYEHDFLPLLVTTSALGWNRLTQLSAGWRGLAVVIVVLLTLVACWVNFVVAQSSGSPQIYMQEWGYILSEIFNAAP